MPDLVVLSPCFYETAECASVMLKSAQVHGLNALLYGIGEPFIPHGADAQVLQLHRMMKYGKKLADHVLVTDCRDVLFQAGPEEIMAKYRKFGKEIVMSAETGCWPPDQEIAEFYYGKDQNGYNYVNAGQYIGEWEYVVGCLEFLLFKYRGQHPGADNSQGWWMWAKMRGELDFALDSRCEIFQTMSGGSDSQIVADRGGARNVRTGTTPCTFHFNGCPGIENPQLEMWRRIVG